MAGVFKRELASARSKGRIMTIGAEESMLQQSMPLTEAYLCQDCDSVGNSSMQCLACASEVLMGLAAVLDRQVEGKKKREKKLVEIVWTN
jgi:hypothetical protein